MLCLCHTLCSMHCPAWQMFSVDCTLQRSGCIVIKHIGSAEELNRHFSRFLIQRRNRGRQHFTWRDAGGRDIASTIDTTSQDMCLKAMDRDAWQKKKTARCASHRLERIILKVYRSDVICYRLQSGVTFQRLTDWSNLCCNCFSSFQTPY